MRLLRQLNSRQLLLGIVIIYFLLRLPSLTLQPIFADEAIYIRWAQIAKAEESLRFISLQDGKTPLFMWAMAPNLIIFEDPLFAGRFLSVISGLFTLLGVYMIGKKSFNLRVGLMAAFLVAITPFMVFFDRMALVDSMLAAFTIWSIYWGLTLAQNPTIKIALILGILLGGGWLTKTPGLVNIVLLPLLLLLFDFKKEKRTDRLLKFLSFFALSGTIGLGMYLFQKIDPNFHQLSARNSDYVHPWSRLLQYPYDPLNVHFLDTINFSFSFLGPLMFLIPLAIIYAINKKNRIIIILLLWSLIPFIYELQFIKAYTARYILFCLPPLLIVTAWVLENIWQMKKIKMIAPIAFLMCACWSIYFGTTLLINPATTPLARAERHGYLEDWTAGYGLKEVANYLINQSQNQIIVVGTEGSFGTLPDGLLIYLDRYFHQSETQKIIVMGGKNFVSDTVRNFSNEKPTFFVANKSRYIVPEPGLVLIKQYPKATGSDLLPDAILFYKVNPITK